MVVCHCRRVSDAVIAAAIASGASSVSEVTRRCRAGGRCGGCVSTIEELLAQADALAADGLLTAEPAA